MDLVRIPLASERYHLFLQKNERRGHFHNAILHNIDYGKNIKIFTCIGYNRYEVLQCSFK